MGAPEGGDDLSGADELRLGEIVKEKHGVDFFVVDRYPSSIRPFYTMLDPSDSSRSNSYDFFLRGQEICPGAPDLSASLKSYMQAFEHGAPPHAGCGFGLER